MNPLRTGLIGLSATGMEVFQVAGKSPFIKICAVADHLKTHDADALEWSGATYFEDARSMILSQGLDLLLMALPPFAATEYVRLAATAKLPTWQTAPPFNCTATGQELAHEFEMSGCPYRVDRFWEDEPAYSHLADAAEQIGELRHGLVTVRRAWFDEASWKQDQEKAGGGLLLYTGYSVLDWLISSLGPVDQVFALTHEVDIRRQGPEASCSAILSHSRGFKVVVSCVEAIGGQSFELSLFGSRGSMIADGEGVRIYDGRGKPQATLQRQCRIEYLQSINSFAEELANRHRTVASIDHAHLDAISTIEAAYLSMRTNQPERPAQLRRVHQAAD